MSPSTPSDPAGESSTDAPPTFRLSDRPDPVGDPDAPPGYALLGTLGRGGMGVVYHARQTDLGREVAIKMILAGGHAGDADLARFETEMKAVAAVEHPNVVRVHHAGRHRGRPFLAMEYLPGGSLADKLRDGPLPPREAARVVSAVARGIAACHARGVLHRDLKPGNILLSGFGSQDSGFREEKAGSRSSSSLTPDPRILNPAPKVSDFGLAKRLDSADGQTHTGDVLGTPSYMAPEQAAGESVGPPADVYGLGAVLYATLTGRPPFQSPAVAETLRRVIEDTPVSLRQLQPTVPRDVETICDKCLHKDAGRRYASADALADDLDRWLAGEPILARRAGPVERGWKWAKRNRKAAAAIAVLAAVAAIAVWQAVEARAARAAAEAEAENVRRAQTETAAEARRGEDVNDFLQDVLTQASADVQLAGGHAVNPDLPVRTAVDYAVGAIAAKYADQPLREADVRWTVGTVYAKLGDPKSAARQFEIARDLRLAHAPATDPGTLAVLNNLGEAYRLDKRLADAEAVTRAAIDGRRATLGHHRDTYQSLNNLGLILRDAKRPADAAPVLEDALNGRESVLGPDHPETLKTVNNLGLCRNDLKEYEAAERLFLRAKTGRAKALPVGHPEAIQSVFNLARFYDLRGRPAEALPLYREGMELQARTAPTAAETTARRLSVAQFLERQKLFAEAADHYEAAYAAAAADPGRRRQVAGTGLAFFGRWADAARLAGWKARCGPDLPAKP